VTVGVETIESEIVPLAQRHGLTLYDLEMIPLGRPMLRVYVEKSSGGVQIGEIEAFARVLIPYLNLKELFPREGNVEVSSPGIFRKLRRPAHFQSAVGEPIGVTAQLDEGKRSITAKLVSVSEEGIRLDSEQLPFVPFDRIVRAQLQPEVRI